LAGLFFLFGKSLTAVKIANMLLAFGVAWLMTRIVRNMSSRLLLILGPPALFLLHPGTLIAESRGGSEILFAFLLTLFILTVYKAIKSGLSRDYLISGLWLGLTVLVRSTPILFPLVLLGYFLVFDRRTRPGFVVFRNVTVMILAMFVVLSPWIIRNYTLTRRFVPTASVLGVSAQTGFYLATHHPIGNLSIDRAAARERNQFADALGYSFKEGYYQYFYSSTDEVDFSNHLVAKLLDSYQQSPILFIRVVGVNLFNFWFGGRTWQSVALNVIVQLPLLIFAIVGAVACLKNSRGKSIAPLALMILYIVAISVPILALARYSVPLVPFVSILAFMSLAAEARRKNEDHESDQIGFVGSVRTIAE
jgi:4-amino-4-deoxy-L-arabinose transferase-like glycosyltransferase